MFYFSFISLRFILFGQIICSSYSQTRVGTQCIPCCMRKLLSEDGGGKKSTSWNQSCCVNKTMTNFNTDLSSVRQFLLRRDGKPLIANTKNIYRVVFEQKLPLLLLPLLPLLLLLTNLCGKHLYSVVALSLLLRYSLVCRC